MKILNFIIGDFGEKKRYRENEKRARKLPEDYAKAYKEIRHYLWNTSGILTIEPLISLVDLFEEASASGKTVVEVTGKDVATFADEFVSDESSYKNQQRKKLNDKLNKKGK